MRIIGGHDYYDSAAQFGVDTTICFIRNVENEFKSAKDIPLNINKPLFTIHPTDIPAARALYKHVRGDRDWTSFFIIVADSIWKGIKVRNGSTYYFSHADFVEHLTANETEYHTNNYYNNLKGQESLGESFFGENKISKTMMDWMIENRVAIITGFLREPNEGHEVCINPSNLKDYDFFRVLDAFQAHQRIEQWVTGVLPNVENPTVKIVDDKIKAGKHGFDKWSFRKPGKKGM